jgi:hypothetical protein
LNDTTPPTILGVTVIPSSLKVGDARAEIQANVHDPSGIKTVYALVGNRMNLMIDLKRTNQYTGFRGSNLPPGTYSVTIVAVDEVGNAAQAKATTNLIILDPRDLNDDHIDDEVFNRVEQLSAIGLGPNEIAGTVSRESKLSLDLIKYVIKHSS